MTVPDLILLNGASSSGKTSVSKCLQELLLPRIYLGYSIDNILYSLPPSALKRMTSGQDISDLDYSKLVHSYYESAHTLLSSGNFLVMDDAVTEPEIARKLETRFADFRMLTVGLHCSLEALKARELARGDRTIGEAEWQFPQVHRHLKYSLEIDSTQASPEALSRQIMDFIAKNTAP